MAENSLFAILLRSSWWVSFLVAAVIVLLSALLLPTPFIVYGAIVGLPFMIIGCIAAWRQLQAPSAATITAVAERSAALGREEFATLLAQGFEREGHAVRRIEETAADLELMRAGRTVLVACRRWKAGRTGVEPLRELQALREERNAQGASYVTLGEITDTARRFAATHGIVLVEAPELARLLRGLPISRGS